MLSPMQLEKTWLQEMAVETIDIDEVQPDESPSYQFHELDFDILKNTDEPAFRVKLILEIRGVTDGTYSAFKRVRIVLWGQFLFAPDASQELMDTLVPLNQLSILYGVARGIVAVCTGTSPAGSFTLPTVNFHKLIEAKQQATQAHVGPPKKRRRAIAAKAESAVKGAGN